MLAFAVGSIVPTTRKDIGLRSRRILSAVLSSLRMLYIYMRTSQTEVGGALLLYYTEIPLGLASTLRVPQSSLSRRLRV
jgi:hypothetical protein